jgi:TRAP-type mannitol/chloroaromatic compound transport system substrate-binding protein
MGLDQWNELPSPYQEIVRTAAHEASTIMMARYDVKNPPALQSIQEAGVELRPFPDDVMDAVEQASFEIIDQFASDDADVKSVFDEWSTYRDQVRAWRGLAELAMLEQGARSSDGGSGQTDGG